jgi:transcription elongation factor Elf1
MLEAHTAHTKIAINKQKRRERNMRQFLRAKKVFVCRFCNNFLQEKRQLKKTKVRAITSTARNL